MSRQYTVSEKAVCIFRIGGALLPKMRYNSIIHKHFLLQLSPFLFIFQLKHKEKVFFS